MIEQLETLTEALANLKNRVGSDDGQVEVLVGYTAAHAAAVHELIEMRLKGLSRDPRLRRIERGGSQKAARPRQRKDNPKGRYWDPQGQAEAKFLENPARELSNDGTLVDIVIQAMAGGATLAQAIMLAGLLLQRESQERVPVDDGILKNSAFTRIEKGNA